MIYSLLPTNTTYEQDIDEFIKSNFAPENRKLATIQMNLIVLKGIRATLSELNPFK